MLTSVRLVVAGATTTIALVGATSAATAAGGSSPPPGRLVIIQAVPGASLDVTLDGRTVQSATDVGSVLGPLTVSPGQHDVGFVDGSGNVRLTSTVAVASGSSHDVVVHLPASVDGTPVVNSYRTPSTPIAPGKARVLIAHTATVAPADVRVDGQVAFRDIANGEYATADLAAGKHVVALLPTGLTQHPILGPLPVDLKAGTVTMVYAVGNPRHGSMQVIAHTAALDANGAVVPTGIDTGAAGFAAGVPVHPFVTRAAPSAGTPAGRSAAGWSAVVAALVATGLGLGQVRRRCRPRHRAAVR